jgi:L-threonylcarbamoyladenylate synthase
MGPAVSDAVRALARGRLVVYPTDTLLGLGASARNARAVRALLRAKGRPEGTPISIALSSLEEVDRWAQLSPPARAWARAHLPGPFTLLVRPSSLARRRLPAAVLPPGGRLGVRVPDHPVARELARRAGPVTATSANRHGRPPARGVAAARRAFGTEVAVYVPAVPTPSHRPSTLVDLTGRRPLRVERR